ncbi:hypothetical protein Ahy_A07g033994 [Arachis hypogaea]|uniref:Zinc finger GRF-type domain-containing protein n=1 Tax=Arachis hypogaea TaxID=3818 RepID=A0A445CAM7_ARAHY|nr:hypothetical protein Ahy_A07g033994 [Arachis hypogaea]
MATNGASSTSRRSVNKVRQENSASNSVSCVVHAGDLNDGVIPRTISNPNRIFLGCAFYKGKQPHCKFFVWVNEHLARIGSNDCISDKRHLGEKDVEVVEKEEKLDVWIIGWLFWRRRLLL